jgi:hypothetical protein
VYESRCEARFFIEGFSSSSEDVLVEEIKQQRMCVDECMLPTTIVYQEGIRAGGKVKATPTVTGR